MSDKQALEPVTVALSKTMQVSDLVVTVTKNVQVSNEVVERWAWDGHTLTVQSNKASQQSEVRLYLEIIDAANWLRLVFRGNFVKVECAGTCACRSEYLYWIGGIGLKLTKEFREFKPEEVQAMKTHALSRMGVL